MKDKVYLIQNDDKSFRFLTVSNPVTEKGKEVYDMLMRSKFTERPLEEVAENNGIDLFNNLYNEFFAHEDPESVFDFVVVSDIVPPVEVKYFLKEKETDTYKEIDTESLKGHKYTLEPLSDDFAKENHCLEAVELLEFEPLRFIVDESIQRDLGEEYRIIIDKSTGVQYLHYQGLDDKGQDGAAMCVLVDKNGKPLLVEQ